ncbi:MAG TPA: integration host factor subunit beta [Dokdonella sp.]|nr:integration host factor subunit beta [Dokdonella sp.]HUD42744.1 integration host factor subunit beta [Dokdonella sp.]
MKRPRCPPSGGQRRPTTEHSASMTKSELIEALAARQVHLAANDVELAVKSLLEQMSQALADGDRIEIRGFGSFSLHYRPPRMGRNPKTGDAVALPGKHVPHFKPGKELRERVNESAKQLLQSND